MSCIEWLNGELLGDGCLVSQAPCSARFKYSSKYFEYICYISDTLHSFGIEQSGVIYKHYHKKLNYSWYSYQSKVYKFLLPLYKQWYPKGKKIVSRNIKLMPLTVKQWYIGDGCLIHKKGERPCIRLATCGFSVSDVEWLIKQLIKLEFKTTRQASGNTINISVHSTKKFLDYIGNSPTKCYNYKFNY